MDNLLIALHRWAWRQDENFTTEAFAHLLKCLLSGRSCNAGIEIINWLSDYRVRFDLEHAQAVEFHTQLPTEQGKPDLTISGIEELVMIEAKVESEQGPDQLIRYANQLKDHSKTQKALVFLTRYPEAIPQQLVGEVIGKRWYQVAEKLREIVNHGLVSPNDLEANYLIVQFLNFLRERNVTMERVGWELENGVRSWSSLMSMAQEAVSSFGYVPVSTFGKDWVGWYLQEKDGQGRRLGQSLFYLGAYWDKPKILVFQTEGVIVPSNFTDIAKCGKMLGPTKWSNELDLDSEEVHFFAKSESSQLQSVIKFLESCLDLTKNYKVGS